MQACYYELWMQYINTWQRATLFLSPLFLSSSQSLPHMNVQTHRCTITHTDTHKSTQSTVNPCCRLTLTQGGRGIGAFVESILRPEAFEQFEPICLFLSGLCELVIHVALPDKSSFSLLRNKLFCLAWRGGCERGGWTFSEVVAFFFF